MEIKSIGVKNFRSFDTSENNFIRLNRINLLLGKNSSGKSSFLRLFPLFKQSIENETSSPILWFTENLVDFDSLNTVRNKNYSNNNEKVTFKFEILLDESDYKEIYPVRNDDLIKMQKNHFLTKSYDKNLENLKFNIELALHNEKLFSLTLSHSNSGFEFYLEYSESNYTVNKLFVRNNIKNEFDILKDLGILSDMFQISHKNSLFPMLKRNQSKLPTNLNSFLEFGELIGNSLLDFILDIEFIKTSSNRDLKKVPMREADSKLMQQVDLVFSPLYRDFEKDYKKTITTILKLGDKSISDETIRSLAANRFAKLCIHILPLLNDKFNEIIMNSRYGAPVRSVFDRYYRNQEFQVTEVDSRGTNLPMLLKSLTPRQMEELNQWVSDNFHFELKFTTSDSGHSSILIKQMNEDYFNNINDVGFGYSQILSVLISIWFEINLHQRNGNGVNSRLTFVIEQPELHLHPSYQAMFGRMVATLIAKHEYIYFILETHSKFILDALSDCIREKIIDANSIELSLFSKIDGNSKIESASFDNEGYVQNWPYGFLSSGAI